MSGNLELANNIFYYSGGFKYVTSNFATMIEQGSNGKISLYTAPSGTAGAAVTLTTAISVLNSGAVGIGTTSPGELLDVNGNAYIRPTGGGTCHITGANGTDVYISNDNASGMLVLRSYDGDSRIELGTTEINMQNVNVYVQADIFTDAWTNWTSSASIGGSHLGSLSYASVYYQKLGRRVNVMFDIQYNITGSNSTLYFTLPYASTTDIIVCATTVLSLSGGASGIGYVFVSGGGYTTANLFPTSAGGLWTAGFLAKAQGQFFYYTA